MKRATMVATAAAMILGSAIVGCTPKPAAVYAIDRSALPPGAKALLGPDAQITSVHQAVYAKGGKDYIIDYKQDGIPKQVKYADYHQSQPTFVFERFDFPETR